MSTINNAENEKITSIPPQIIQQIIKMLERLRYGSVEVVIHDAKIVQIERREKVRF